MRFSPEETANTRAGKFSAFLRENPEFNTLIELSEAEKLELIQSPTPIVDNKGNEIALILIKALQGHPVAKEKIYAAYLKHAHILIPKILLLLTGRKVSYEIRSTLSLGDKEEGYKITVASNAINIKMDNYLPRTHQDEKGQVVHISLSEMEPTAGVHPVVHVYSSANNKKPTAVSLSGAHRTKIRATLDLEETFNSDQWAFVRCVIAKPDGTWQGYNVYVNLLLTKAPEIESAAKETLSDFLTEQGFSNFKILIDESDWGPLSKIQIHAKAELYPEIHP